jgi:hypothetical protein
VPEIAEKCLRSQIHSILDAAPVNYPGKSSGDLALENKFNVVAVQLLLVQGEMVFAFSSFLVSHFLIFQLIAMSNNVPGKDEIGEIATSRVISFTHFQFDL